MLVASIEIVWASVRNANGGIGIHGVKVVCGIGSDGKTRGRVVSGLKWTIVAARVV